MERKSLLGSRMTSINGVNYKTIQICSTNKLEDKKCHWRWSSGQMIWNSIPEKYTKNFCYAVIKVRNAMHISNISIQKKTRSLSFGNNKEVSLQQLLYRGVYFSWESLSITIFATVKMCLSTIFRGISPGTSLWEKKMTEPCSWAEKNFVTR